MLRWMLYICLSASLLFMPGCTPVRENKPAIDTTPYYPPSKPRSTYIPRPNVKPPITLPGTGSMVGKTVMIDPGHGGKDPGAPNRLSSSEEKDLNLIISKELAKQLKSRGAKIIMTRMGDTFVELDDRARAAEMYDADLFVAVHCNAHPDRSRSGAVVYTSREPSQRSRWAALAINYAIENSGIPSENGQADYKVLTLHNKPAVLVECGYFTNSSDLKKLNTSAYRTKIATAVANGIAGYFAKH